MRTKADRDGDPGSGHRGLCVSPSKKMPGPVPEVNDEEGVAPCLRPPWRWALFFPHDHPLRAPGVDE